MPLINSSLPNLIQGVSQQPDVLRYDGQCEEQENALSSVVEGLTKRPNTRHVARLLSEAISNDSFVHFINRSDTERYVVIHDGTVVRAWNILTGNPATINGQQSYTPPSNGYLDCDPRHLKALTVADTTFVTNTATSVALNTDLTAEIPKEALVFIKQGDYKKKYSVTVNINKTNNDDYVAATATVAFTPYVYRTRKWRSRYGTNTTSYYRHRVSSVTITNAGSGYREAPTIRITGPERTYTNAVITATVGGTNNGILSLNIVNAGDYGYANESGATLNGTVNITPNATGGGAGQIHLDHYIWSGSSSNSASHHANTDAIASWLSTNGTNAAPNNSGFNQDYDKPFDVGTQNISQFFDVLHIQNSIKITKKDSWEGDFTISTSDSLADTGIDSIYKETSAISDLPARCFNGFKVKINGDAEVNQDDYYVEFHADNGANFGAGTWKETVGFGVEKGFDSATMPHVFKSVDVDKFEFQEMDFSNRNAGDNLSNPNPSFVGRNISSMFFFKNRLGFLSDDNVILSEAGIGAEDEDGIFKYNFYRTTVTTLLDSAPIDVSVASTRVSLLQHAVGFQENLVLFSDNGQFVLKGGTTLTPKTISITPITNFDVESSVSPLALGSYMYFPFNRANYTGIREFTVNASTDNYESVEITEHVPAYIPTNITNMTGTTTEDMIALVSSDTPNCIYMYKFFWSGAKKVLSSWFKFTFKEDIVGIQFVDSLLYIIGTHNNETHLCELPLQSGLEDNAGYTTYLDQREEVDVVNNNTITLSYTPTDDDEVQVYTKDGLKLTNTRNGSTITLTQNTTETKVWAGYPYTMKYTFSEQLFKATSGNAKTPSGAAKLLIRNCSLFYNNTAFFQVKVQPKHRDVFVNTFTPDVVGATTLGSLVLDEGFYRFPVFSQAQDTKITIENDSALPSNFTSAEFESFTHSRSRRYG